MLSRIGADSPSFVGYPQAAAAFFGVDAAANSNYGWAAPCLRFPDRTARIEAVVIRPAELAVTVVGDQLDGLFIELAGNTAGPIAALVARGPLTVRFGLPDGLPAGAWVLIPTPTTGSTGVSWADRMLSRRSPASPGRRPAPTSTSSWRPGRSRSRI